MSELHLRWGTDSHFRVWVRLGRVQPLRVLPDGLEFSSLNSPIGALALKEKCPLWVMPHLGLPVPADFLPKPSLPRRLEMNLN